ncbi:hypothetical protein A2U01_0064997, partial [Trifolium medium]|nr:hypothetical protein [Trifolium medium]
VPFLPCQKRTFTIAVLSLTVGVI